MTSMATMFGRGLGFPVQPDSDSRVRWSEGVENIRESIRIILSTEPGERLMLPTFGAGLKRFLFEPNVVTTHRRIEEAVVRSLDRWERRIKVEEVQVRAEPDDAQAALVTIRYTVVANRADEQLHLRVRLGA